MSDEPKMDSMNDEEDNGADLDAEFFEDDFDDYEDDYEIVDPAIRSAEAIENVIETMLSSASVDAVYGEPINVGDHTIIPAAEVISALGFGVGYGSGSSSEDEESPENQTGAKGGFGSGGGGGGGGRVFSRPVAIIIASPGEVRIEPIVDVTKLALAALTAAGFMATMIMRMNRGLRKGDDFEG